MKYLLIIISFIGFAQSISAQKLDSIFFNLYTDSLKKGTYNYINVEGHFSDGTYLPLNDKELKFTSSAGKFSGNSLFIDSSFKEEKVNIKVVLIKNPRLSQEIEVYIKKYNADERLPTVDEVLHRKSGNTPAETPKKRKSKR